MNSNGAVRPYRADDYVAVQRIYIDTGYVGHALTVELFRDPKLFSALYLDCYANQHAYRKHFFVYQQDNEVMGYINGALDTNQFNYDYSVQQVPLIQERIATLAPADRYQREKLIAEKAIAGYIAPPSSPPESPYGLAKIINDYPAHLHINVSPTAQRGGVGSALLCHYEEHCRAHGVGGIHLTTSNYNKSACVFYEKQHYKAIQQPSASLWPELTDCLSVVYVKRL